MWAGPGRGGVQYHDHLQAMTLQRREEAIPQLPAIGPRRGLQVGPAGILAHGAKAGLARSRQGVIQFILATVLL